MMPLPGPGPGSGAFGLRRFSPHCLSRLACRWALLSTPSRVAACGLGAGSFYALAAGVPAVQHGPGDEPKPQRRANSGLPFGHKRRRVTDSLLVLNCVCIMLQWLSRGLLTLWGAKINSYIAAGQLWRLVTPTFLHSGLAHLLVNSYALNALGPELEVISGGRRFLSIYMVSAVTGTVASYLMTPQPSLGSSGSIFGIAAALALFYWRHQESLGKTSDNVLRQLGVTAAINVGLSIFVRNIDNWGHLGGLIGGAATAYLIGPHMRRNEKGRFQDQPPLRLLAHPEGYMFSTGARARTAAGDAPPAGGARGEAGAGEGGEGKGSGRQERRGPRLPRRQRRSATPPEGAEQNPD